MLNILIPLAGHSKFFDSERYLYPVPLLEISGKLMIQRVIDNLSRIKEDKNFIFVLNEEDCRKHHLDDVISLLVKDSYEIIRLQKPTKGAACSCLMAIEHIDNEQPLLIANGDQIVESDLTSILSVPTLQANEVRVFCMQSVHPRWSYVSADQYGKVVEVAEKRPISNRAIAGFYLFSHGGDFVKSAMEMIRKGDDVDSNYYVAPCLNQHILMGMPVNAYDLPEGKYFSFYTPERVAEYEEHLVGDC